MHFKIINIYSKELADAIIDFVQNNKLITKRNNNSYWNKEGKLKYFLKNRTKENYNFEEDPDLVSSSVTHTIILFDDIVEIRYLFNCCEDETDLDLSEVINRSSVDGILKQISKTLNFIFDKTIKLDNYKDDIEKIYSEEYELTLCSSGGSVRVWEKGFEDFALKSTYEDYGIYTSEDFNEFPYILNPEFLPMENFDLGDEVEIENLKEEFIDNIIKKGDKNKIEIVRPNENFEKEDIIINENNAQDDFSFMFRSFAEEANRLSEQISSVTDELLENKELESLTRKQEEILDYIVKCYSETRIVPSIREMCVELGLRSPATLSDHVKNLENKGYITKNENKKIIPLIDSKGNRVI